MSRPRASLAAVALAGLAAGGCATAPATPALFVVLPGPDGHVGHVVVRQGCQASAIDRAYGAQRVRPDGRVEAIQLTEAEVRAAFGPTLAALPARPVSFTLYFLEGRDELTAESQAQLDGVLAELRRRPLPDVLVTGHTDTVGADDMNDRLSLARAQRLREVLAGIGIPSARIQVAGRGKRELLVPTGDNVAEARNRRVEISVR